MPSPPRPVLSAPSATEPDSMASDSKVSARRQKKREIDRRCQRQARERTKSRIAYLENLVEDLQQQDAGGRVAALTKQLYRVEKERDAMSRTLKDVQKAMSKHHTTEDTGKNSSPEMGLPRTIEPWEDSPVQSLDDVNLDSFTQTALPMDHLTSSTEGPLNPLVLQQDTAFPFSPSGDSTEASDLILEPIVPKPGNTCDCCREEHKEPQHPPKNLWRYANATLLERYKGNAPITPAEDYLVDDIAIRVLLEGWDAVEARMGLPISWSILRRIDDALFYRCPNTERLAVLKTMHMLLQYHRDPSPERYASLPSWYLQRPSQTLPHSYAINFFVWPGLRERFVFYQHHYCSNIFWDLFSTCLNIKWAYDFRDCFVQRSDTGLYEISPLFRECIGEISSWTMRPDMFGTFPELRGDIPISLSAPRPLSNVVQLQLANAKNPNFRQLETARKLSKTPSDVTKFPTESHYQETLRKQMIPQFWDDFENDMSDTSPDLRRVNQMVTWT